jgi:hypothetical protein
MLDDYIQVSDLVVPSSCYANSNQKMRTMEGRELEGCGGRREYLKGDLEILQNTLG